MQAPQPGISGTRDYAGGDAVALQTARDAIDAALRRYGYAAIDPPILESPLPFLNRSGEDIRRQMYIFPDPGGREVCLRPELTIPVCRAYLRETQSSAPRRANLLEREARLSYFGPAFTYESASEGRYRQFYQAGAEFIGAQSREAADAEVLAAALDCLDATGLKQAAVEIGDVDIRNAFIDNLPISDRSKTRIRRIALRNQKNPSASSALARQTADSPEHGNDFGALASLLASVEPGKAELLIREVFALADVRHVGGRTPEEIVERLTSRTAQQSEPISAELIDGVMQLLNIRAEPEAAFKTIRDHFRKFGISAIDPVLDRCDKRLRYITAYGSAPAAIQFNVGLRRGLEYYTGFMFEIFAKNAAQAGHVCGGGRYDNLLEGLGAGASIPAVGFGIGLDRLLRALQSGHTSPLPSAPIPQALVSAAGATANEEQCIRIGATLRRAGWSVEIEGSVRDEKSTVQYATEREIPFVVFTGDISAKQEVRIKHLRDRTEQRVALTGLADFAERETAKTSPGRLP